MRRRLILFGILTVLLSGIGSIVWTLAGLPPVRFLFRYGLGPGCEPTGRERKIDGIEFVEIGPGIFRMGSDHLEKGGDLVGRFCEPLGLPWGERPRPSAEMPVHWVELERAFWIARTEVTNAQYESLGWVRGRSMHSTGENTPVVEVTWIEAKDWCARLAKKSGLPVRLPSEAEWECACRAGTDTEYSFGDDAGNLVAYAQFSWRASETGPHVRPVATLRPNPWDLYDMHGNVFEWCEDVWHQGYAGTPDDGSPRTTGDSPARVYRGGGWFVPKEQCRSAHRDFDLPTFRYVLLGFRPAFSLPEEKR